jgi:UDP-3-O-[3-hydroxymyristoyl] N-acetylglucosamine deacetylase
LDNAVVIDGFEIMNPEGLRYADEFVRHKILDVIGDLSLIGMPVIGKVTMHCSGHAMNARLVNAVLSDSRAYEIVELNDSFQRDLRPTMGDLSFFESVNSLA